MDKEFVSQHSAMTSISPVVAQVMLRLLKDGRRQNLDEPAEPQFVVPQPQILFPKTIQIHHSSSFPAKFGYHSQLQSFSLSKLSFD
jgi:hypothetical protein